MKLGRDYNVFPHHDPWPRVAAACELAADRLRERVLALADVTPDAFLAAARDPSVATLKSPLPEQLVDLVAERVTRCRRAMG